MAKWNITVKRLIKKIKKDPSDDFDTEYVDIDALLGMYIEYFKLFKTQMQKRITTQFKRVTQAVTE